MRGRSIPISSPWLMALSNLESNSRANSAWSIRVSEPCVDVAARCRRWGCGEGAVDRGGDRVPRGMDDAAGGLALSLAALHDAEQLSLYAGTATRIALTSHS